MGFIIEVISRYCLKIIKSDHFHPHFFHYFILPPIILHIGYHLEKGKFFKSFKYAILFGIFGLFLILGTFVNYLIIISFTFLISELDLIKIN